MDVVCEGCGKEYKIDPAKLKGRVVTVACNACQHKIRLTPPALWDEPVAEEYNIDMGAEESAVEVTMTQLEETAAPEETQSGSRKGHLSVRTKIFLLFVVLPVALIIAAGYLYTNRISSLSDIIHDESHDVVEDLAQQIIYNKALDVAGEVRIFLDAHPEITPEELHNNPVLMEIAIQKIGKNGYTVLNWAPHDGKPWMNLAGPRPYLILKDVSQQLKAKFTPEQYRTFQSAREQALKTHKPVASYYHFIDDKEKFQVLAPVPDTDFWLVATTYLDEFTQPMNRLDNEVTDITTRTVQTVFLIIGITALLVALIALFYGSKLSWRVQKLMTAADQISMGELNVEIGAKSNDELGDLAQSISRMQESIRLSIERLRQRRKTKKA